MKISRQSSQLRAKFQQQVQQKVSASREAVEDKLGGGWLGSLGATLHDIRQLKNQAKGFIGETVVNFLLTSFDDTWVAFPNALIPATNGKLTEVDLLIVGLKGVFLIEVKTWSGSFSAYRDKWKQRSGNVWVALENSPTEQSLYHQKMFYKWIINNVSDLAPDAVSAPVVFTIAKWIGATHCSVPVCLGVKELKKLIDSSDICLTTQQVELIKLSIEGLDLSVPISSIKPKPILRKPITSKD